jgi:hypothetical protein
VGGRRSLAGFRLKSQDGFQLLSSIKKELQHRIIMNLRREGSLWQRNTRISFSRRNFFHVRTGLCHVNKMQTRWGALTSRPGMIFLQPLPGYKALCACCKYRYSDEEGPLSGNSEEKIEKWRFSVIGCIGWRFCFGKIGFLGFCLDSEITKSNSLSHAEVCRLCFIITIADNVHGMQCCRVLSGSIRLPAVRVLPKPSVVAEDWP